MERTHTSGQTLRNRIRDDEKPSRNGQIVRPSTTKVITEAKLRSHALETFGSTAKAEHWLNRSSQVFQGKTPLQALKTDSAAVEAELTRIDHGVYI